MSLAAPALAASVTVDSDGTITVNITGDPGADGGADAAGVLGAPGVEWTAQLVDVIIEEAVAITGGNGGDGGPDDANDGGNAGGVGGHGLSIVEDDGTVTTDTDVAIVGGLGGAGSAGGTGGAADTGGGHGGLGGYGILAGAGNVQITLYETNVVGGMGGAGGSAGDAAGDATDVASGGNGGFGGAGIAVDGGTGVAITLTNANVAGGQGAEGGQSLANADGSNGGGGGAGIADNGVNTTILIDADSIVVGGDGGSAGLGGLGGAGAGPDGSGVYLQGMGASLTNHGIIVGNDAGIGVFVTSITTLIDNYGAIGAPVGHNGTGVLIGGAGIVATFRNRADGLIQSSGDNAVQIGGGTVTNFINEGAIATNGAAPAVLINGGGTVVNFTNSGIIQSVDAAALFLQSAGAPDLIDNTGGAIIGASASDAAVLIGTDLGANGITFDGGGIANTSGYWAIDVAAAQSGDIVVKNAEVGGGIRFTADEEDLDVTAGTLNGDVVFAGGVNVLNFTGFGTTTIGVGTDLISSGTLVVNVVNNASVILNEFQDAADSKIDNLELDAISDLTLNAPLLVAQSIVMDGTLTIGPEALLAGGALTGAGTYIFQITEDSFQQPKLGVFPGGGSLDFTGATFEISLVEPATLFANGTLVFLAADVDLDPILGVQNGTALTDNSALLDFVLYRGDAPGIGSEDGYLFAQVQLLLLADIAAYGDDPNAIALGGALDTIGLDGDDDIDDVMQKLAGLPTDAAINAVLDSLLPETDGVAYDIATDAGDQVLDVASRRLDALRALNVAAREYRVASTAPVGPGSGKAASYFWAQAFGRAVDQSKHDFNDGYDAGTYGFALGADTAFSGGKAQLGLAFSYAATDADGNGVNHTDTSVDSYQLTLYGDHVFADGVYAKGLLAYGWHQNDIVRHDVGGVDGNNASGAYDARQFSVRAELGRAFASGRRLTLIPHLTINYAAYDPDGYTEAGVGGLGLTVDADHLQSLRVGAGLLARWDFALNDGGHLQPELRVSYRNDLTRERFETTSEFLGAPDVAFRTQGVEPPADILNLGLGALLATAGGIDLRASYDLELKEDYTAHGGYIRASLPF